MGAGAKIYLYRGRGNFMDLGSPYDIVIDGQGAGEIHARQLRVFRVYSGEHSLYVTFLRIRWSQVLEFSIRTGEKAEFICRSNWLGYPTLRAVTPSDRADADRYKAELTEETILSRDPE